MKRISEFVGSSSAGVKLLKICILFVCLLATMPAISQNLQKEEDLLCGNFSKCLNLTVDIGGGCNGIPIFYDDIFPGYSVGMGMRYDYSQHWGLATCVTYANFFVKNYDYNVRSLLIPIEVEYHLAHFYMRAGVVLGPDIKTKVAANADILFRVGGTIGLGGRFQITPKDRVSVGLQCTLVETFEHIYESSRFLKPGMPHYFDMLMIGFEHQF